MKIDNAEVEFVFEKDEFDKRKCHFHVLQFVKTPRGRRKELIRIMETIDKYGTGWRLVEVDIALEGAKTVSERRKLISHLLRGSIRPKTCLNGTTIKLLETPDISRTKVFFVRFD